MRVQWKKWDYKRIEDVLIVLLAVLLLLNLFLISTMDLSNSQKEEKVKLKVTVITTECASCFNMLSFLESLKQNHVEIKKETVLAATSEKALALIEKYEITKLPAMIVDGDVEKVAQGLFEERKGVHVLKEVPLPYVNAQTGEIVGLVDVKVLFDPLCARCANASVVVSQFMQLGLKINEQRMIDVTRDNSLFNRYNLKIVPTIVLSHDISLYPFFQQLESYLIKTPDGNYLVPPQPPYEDITTGQMVGLVSLTKINDKKCAQCYTVDDHLPILRSFGIDIVEEKVVDISSLEGKALVKKYGIKKVPTIILSGDARYYSALANVWEKVGKVAEDGSYVFVAVESMGTYKDLEQNNVVG